MHVYAAIIVVIVVVVIIIETALRHRVQRGIHPKLSSFQRCFLGHLGRAEDSNHHTCMSPSFSVDSRGCTMGCPTCRRMGQNYDERTH